MRGFAKAAALLSSTLAWAIVLPTSESSKAHPADPTVEYRQSQALLTFQLSSPFGDSESPPLILQVDPTEEYCGEDAVSINGRPLKSLWDEGKADGSGDIDFHDLSARIYATWQITCLAGGIDTSNVDGVQVLSLWFKNQNPAPGFTVSYQAFPTPRILQFISHPSGSGVILKNGLFWRTPSELTRDVSVAVSKDVGKKTSLSAKSRQKSLSFHSLGDLIGAEVEAVKNAAKKALKQCRHQFPALHSMFDKLSQDISSFLCPRRHKTSHGSSHALQDYVMGSSRIPDGVSSTDQESLDTSEHLTSSAIQDISADSSRTSGLTYDLKSINPDLEPSQWYHQLRTLGLSIVLVALFVWAFKWLRDPRRRADRAARREERCRRHLYRRAACIQKLRNFFNAFRRPFYPATHVVRNWDEKQALVHQQEEILETVMKDEIRALFHAHREENNLAAAEEGRNHYVHEMDGRSERRRSMTTLPDYESEGTQPPGYESDAVSLSDRFLLYTPVDSEDTPDSSVISTSPRISRDGRDSDFEKEVLGEWTLDSGPLVGPDQLPFDRHISGRS